MLPDNNDTRVILFGTFDPPHEGHSNLFQQAASLGNYLIVVVARDAAIVSQKGRSAFMQEHQRLALVAKETAVNEAILGDSDPSSYSTLRKVRFDILALGYDQKPSNTKARAILDGLGLRRVRIVRLASYRSNIYKSSLLRK